MNPLVSVIIPVRNGQDTLSHAIDSALGQSWTEPFEVVVADNGSTDATAEILRGYGNRIVALKENRPGPSVARNTAVKAARGKYLAFLDADDEWLPDKLARTVPVLERDPAAVLVYHDAVAVDAAGRVRSEWVVPPTQASNPSLREVIEGACILPSCTVIRREVYERCGGSAEELKRDEDQFLVVRAREQGPFRYVPEALARYQFILSRQKEVAWAEDACTYNQIVMERYGVRGAGSGSLTCLGLVCLARGQRELARERFTAALRLRPIVPKTWVRLAWAYFPDRISRTLGGFMPERVRRALDGPPKGLWECVLE